MRWKRVIGIVGGLGPHAHLELERRILLTVSRSLDRPARDQDFPEWILHSISSTPDRTEALLGLGPSPLPWLQRALVSLSGSNGGRGADFAVIACNTSHAFLRELRQRVRLPILDMIEETVRVAADQVGPSGKVGLLATTGALQSRLYAHAVQRLDLGLEILSPLDVGDDTAHGEQLQEDLVMTPIYGPLLNGSREGGGIKSGLSDEAAVDRARKGLVQAVDVLKQHGIGHVIAGCTEIPLALGTGPIGGVRIVDPLDVVAEASVQIASGARRLPEMG